MENSKNTIDSPHEKDFNTETKFIHKLKDFKNLKQSFTIKHTQIAKGIACLMLLYHHLLRPGNKFTNLIKNDLIFIGIDLRKYTSVFFKINTCSYTFLSGIGILYSLNKYKNIKDMYKKCIKYFFRLMIIFWIILFFAYPKGIKTGLFNLNYSTLIHCIFADYYKKGNWWYIRMHFALLIYSPLFVRLFQDINYKSKIFPILYFYFFYLITKIIHNSFEFKGIKKIFFHYFDYFSSIEIILSFFSGILSAKYNLILCFNNDKSESFYYSLFSIFSAIFIRCNLIKDEGSMKIDFFIVPLFILPITSLIYKYKALANLLILFGKHSTNFWFIHGYFYDNYYIKLLSFPKYSILCYFWLVLLTLICSYIINIILLPIINYINFRRFNYKGYFHFIKQKSA